MLAWGALLITSQLTVAAPLLAVGSGLSFAHSPLWPACRSPIGDDAADRTVVQTKESGELGVSKLTGISRLEDGLVS